MRRWWRLGAQVLALERMERVQCGTALPLSCCVIWEKLLSISKSQVKLGAAGRVVKITEHYLPLCLILRRYLIHFSNYYCSKCMVYNISFSLHKTPVLQVRKLWHWEVQGHTGSNWQNQNLNPDGLTPQPMVLTTVHPCTTPALLNDKELICASGSMANNYLICFYSS